MDKEATTSEGKETCSFSFKKFSVKNRGAVRKRRKNSSEEDGSDEESNPQAAIPSKRAGKSNPNVQHSSGNQKQKPSQTSGKTADSSDEESDVVMSYKSKKSAMSAGPSDQGATAILEIETESDRDAQAIFEKRLEINKQLEGQADDKVYRGMNNYAQYYKPKDTAAGNASSGLVRRGPIRAPANLRATVRWDYQPDICKDYKETGFCGFGDSCKFLHDRSDYKHGWQLEREWQAGEYGKDDDDADDGRYEIPDDDDDLPFKCVICRESFVNPVVTKCKHYFCRKCALENYKKSQRCFVCNAQTNGIFNHAKEIEEKLIKNAKEEAEEKSSEDSD